MGGETQVAIPKVVEFMEDPLLTAVSPARLWPYAGKRIRVARRDPLQFNYTTYVTDSLHDFTVSTYF